jgi:Uma2 family endonuclease
MKLSDLDLTKRYSYADYLSWKLEEMVELIEGFIFPMAPAPSLAHQRLSMRLTKTFVNFFDGHQCELFAAPFDVRLPHKAGNSNDLIITVVQPDLCVVCDAKKLDEQGCIGAPDLIVEILSPGNTKKEMKTKMEVYEQSGVREYWLIHPKDSYILIYTLDEHGKYSASRPYVEGENAVSIIFPELEVDLEKLFEGLKA